MCLIVKEPYRAGGKRKRTPLESSQTTLVVATNSGGVLLSCAFISTEFFVLVNRSLVDDLKSKHPFNYFQRSPTAFQKLN